MAFTVGQVVMLKSGGVPMTVSDPINAGAPLIDVHWHDSSGVMHRDVLHESTLHLAWINASVQKDGSVSIQWLPFPAGSGDQTQLDRTA